MNTSPSIFFSFLLSKDSEVSDSIHLLIKTPPNGKFAGEGKKYAPL